MKLAFATILACMTAALAVESPLGNSGDTIAPSQGDDYNTHFLKEHLDGHTGGGIAIHRREVGSGRARRAPSGCTSNAIPGSCINCNHGGCALFECSAFTQWSCPTGYTHCGGETCNGGLCAGKWWCDKTA